MNLIIKKTKEEMGKAAAKQTAELLNAAIERQGYARILLSTGASQFPFFEEIVKEKVDWSKVEMFHLDEYVGISEEHPASFKRYLLDRFVNKVKPKTAYLIDGTKDPDETIRELTELIREKPVDVGLIGIGENAHIAFNDPPADFEDSRAYKVVTLAERCLDQQIGEGWFKNREETYKQAISMTCSQIMACKAVISVVPYAVKADAVYKTLTSELSPEVPATLLREHENFTLYCDEDSAALLTDEIIAQYAVKEEIMRKKRYVIVGASYRCYTLFICNMLELMSDKAETVGIYDPNRTRAEFFKKKIGDGLTIYDDFDVMLDTEKPDAVVVTTSDLFHHEYIIRALEKGYDVISEKPVTNTYERCFAIREAERKSGKKVAVTFNMRFDPVFFRMKQLLVEGKLGKVHHIAYNHYLDRNHGADYFRRWHRYMKNSQGMLLHKSTHHFDIVNWLIDDEPKLVSALGNRVYFGNEARHMARCCRECKDESCESYALSQTGEADEELYFKAEHEDGYIRDVCAFEPSTDILDNFSVSVQYEGGAVLSYTLNCFSTYECCRLKLVCENGVLELDRNSTEASRNADSYEIRIEYKDGTKETVNVKKLAGTHGGSDEKLVKMLLLGEGKEEDTLHQCADSYAGFSSAMIGVAGNESIETGQTIDLTERLRSLR